MISTHRALGRHAHNPSIRDDATPLGSDPSDDDFWGVYRRRSGRPRARARLHSTPLRPRARARSPLHSTPPPRGLQGALAVELPLACKTQIPVDQNFAWTDARRACPRACVRACSGCGARAPLRSGVAEPSEAACFSKSGWSGDPGDEPTPASVPRAKGRSCFAVLIQWPLKHALDLISET